MIERGELAVGERLPPEDELARVLRVSRMTLRQALTHLTDEGLLVRQRGRGTFVTERAAKIATLSFPPGLDERLRQLGLRPSRRQLGVAVIPAPSAQVAELLHLAPTDRVAGLELLHLGDDEPVALTRAYLPPDMAPALLEADFERVSLLEVLRDRYGYIPLERRTWIEADTVTGEDAAVLGLQAGSPLLCLSTVMHLSTGAPVIFAQVRWRSDRIPLALPAGQTIPASTASREIRDLVSKQGLSDHAKRLVRERIWQALQAVGRPDSRFHWDFSQFVPDYPGSELCAETVRGLDWYRAARLLFMSPDNNLAPLRAAAIRDGKPILMPTHSLARGFLYLDAGVVPPGQEELAATLDGIERFARSVTLDTMVQLGTVDLLVSGASAITTTGIRTGKGHGYFDLEWAILRELGLAGESTPVVAVVHDVQVLDTELEPSPYDTVVDCIVTPTRCLFIPHSRPKPTGIIWDMVSPDLLESIPVLQELAARGTA